MIQIVVQEWLARVTSFWVVFSYFLFLKLRGYRVRNLKLIRKRWRALLKEHPGPWLVCPNHLTMIDSFIVTYGLFFFLRPFPVLPSGALEPAGEGEFLQKLFLQLRPVFGEMYPHPSGWQSGRSVGHAGQVPFSAQKGPGPSHFSRRGEIADRSG